MGITGVGEARCASPEPCFLVLWGITKRYYEQKHLLNTPLTCDSDVVQSRPKSYIDLCVESSMCDQHLDALCCMHSALSRGFNLESLRALAQLYIDHGFHTQNEADLFLADIPVLGMTNRKPLSQTKCLLIQIVVWVIL